MNRLGMLAAIVVMLAPMPGFAQMGGMGGGMGGMGGGMMGGGRLMAAGPTDVERAAQVEMEGGQHLTGRIDLRPIAVQTDLGRYTILPDKIKMIRFLKPANDDEEGDEAQLGANPNGPAAAVMARRAQRLNNAGAAMQMQQMMGGGGGFVQQDPGTWAKGKVITTSGKEIIGNILIPWNFQLELDFGTLTLVPPKLRSITFTEIDKKTTLTSKPDAAEHRADADADAPVEVRTIRGSNFVALALTGPKITRIAVYDLDSGTWHPQDLREPVARRAVPTVAQGVVVYNLGRYVYAYSAEAHRWDVAELPEGMRASPGVGPNGATIEGNGHLYQFIPKTGKWEHIDLRAVLDVVKEGKK